jgi:uncharacterized RDD family membrane protein YckC
MAQPSTQLDSRIEVVTPENIAFKYRVAGPFRRLPAYLIDALIRAGIIVATVLLLGVTFSSGLASVGSLAIYIWFLVEWFYGGFFETYWNGQTPGKWAMGLRVVSYDGQPINALQAVLRNILRAVDAFPAFSLPNDMSIGLYQLGLLASSSNQRFQRLGDLAAHTMVVVEESPRLYGVAKVSEPEAMRLAELIPVSFEPSRSMARALSLYVERRGGFALGRRAEIARHLGEPLRVKFNLPPQTSYDLLLCAVYYRAFVAERVGERKPVRPESPALPVAVAAAPGESRAADVHSLLDQMV